MGAPLEFGTAGLRGPEGPGIDHMNPDTVLGFAEGLSRFLQKEFGPSRICIGFDARPRSREFAHICAVTLAAGGHAPLLFEELTPTPVLAFSVREQGAQAGIAVTASHNPRGDAGIKVFDDRGVQIVSPWDEEIASGMKLFLASAMSDAGEQETAEAAALEFAHRVSAVSEMPLRVAQDYKRWALSAAETVADPKAPPLPVGYSALHGVGGAWVVDLLRARGASAQVVESQFAPDGTFPELPFPNPEEAGVLDQLMLTLRSCGLDWGFANDPDADRLALVLPWGAGGELLPLSGDELGLLLGDAWLERVGIERSLLVSTVVSSPALERLAALHHAELRRTLTGFKWICRAGDDDRFAFGYEEALGYCVARGATRPVLDKDGLSALLVLHAVGCREAARRGTTPGRALLQRYEELCQKIGTWVAAPVSLRVGAGLSAERLRDLPRHVRELAPFDRAPFRVLSVVDYREGAASRPSYLGTQDLLSFRGEWQDGLEVALHLRPSGTEAKLKLYCHLGGPFRPGTPLGIQRRDLGLLARKLTASVLEWWGLPTSPPV